MGAVASGILGAEGARWVREGLCVGDIFVDDAISVEGGRSEIQAMTASIGDAHFRKGERGDSGDPWAKRENDDGLVEDTEDTRAVGRHGGHACRAVTDDAGGRLTAAGELAT